MQTFHHPHQVVLISSRFQYLDRRLFFTRARLYLDRIELTGWHLGKKHERRILLAEVTRIEWDRDASAAIVHLTEGATIRLKLPDVARWQYSLEQHLTWNALGRFPVTSTISTTARRDLSLHELITFTTSMG